MLPRRLSLAMDVDSPSGLLQRSNSAPIINDMNTEISVSTAAGQPSTSRESGTLTMFDSSSLPRTRRFSTTGCSPHSTTSPIPRLTPRVTQLRQEDRSDREVAHEREVHSAMQMSQSWEDLTLVDATVAATSTTQSPSCASPLSHRPRRVTDPLHVSLPANATNAVCSSPSPTRSGVRQFSPLCAGFGWGGALSPSPTRKAFATRRSLSPIALRPSSLGGVKRKFEPEDEACPSQTVKRQNCGLLMAQRLSPTSVGTPESISSADSPGFFRPLDSPSPSAQHVPSPCGHSSSAGDEPMITVADARAGDNAVEG